MHPVFSVYLDLVRAAAALVVYLTHSQLIVKGAVPLGEYGHSAVVVFFVLSGYVVAYVVDQKEHDWRSYAASRLSRVYSVVVPALAITLVADFIGRSNDPSLYPYPWDHFLVRTLGALGMLNEFWFIAITPFSNVPYWSIAYESWFYLVFGVLVYAPARWRWWLAASLLVVVGPKITLLFPLWLSGVALYHWRGLVIRSQRLAALLAIVSLGAIVGLHLDGFFDRTYGWTKSVLSEWLFVQLAFSKFVVGDYALALLVVVNFAAMRALAPALQRWLLPLARPVAALASVTFTLYLTHQPLLLMWASLTGVGRRDWAGWWLVAGLVAVTVWLIAQITEKRRGALRAAILRRLQRLGRPTTGGVVL